MTTEARVLQTHENRFEILGACKVLFYWFLLCFYDMFTEFSVFNDFIA